MGSSIATLRNIVAIIFLFDYVVVSTTAADITDLARFAVHEKGLVACFDRTEFANDARL